MKYLHFCVWNKYSVGFYLCSLVLTLGISFICQYSLLPLLHILCCCLLHKKWHPSEDLGWGLGRGRRGKAEWVSLSHTLHSLASEFTTRTETGSEYTSAAIKNSTVYQGHGVSYVTRIALKSAVTFQRQLSSLIYLHAFPRSHAALTQLDSPLHPITASPQRCSNAACVWGDFVLAA